MIQLLDTTRPVRRAASPPLAAAPLIIATAGSSTLERSFTDYGPYTDNPRVTYSTNGTTWAPLGGTGAGHQTMGNVLSAPIGSGGLDRDIRFLNGAIGGTRASNWGSATAYAGRTNLIAALQAAIGAGASVSDMIILFQAGYNDAITDESVASVAAMETLLRRFCSTVRAAAGLADIRIGIGGSQWASSGNTPAALDQLAMVRQAELNVAADPGNFHMGSSYDQPLTGIHLSQVGYAGTGVTLADSGGQARRWAAAIKAVVQGATVPAAPSMVSGTALTNTTARITFAHGTGTDFTPSTGLTGFRVSVDGGTTWNYNSAGVRQSATTVDITHGNTGGGSLLVGYMNQGDAPNSGAMRDNNVVPLAANPRYTPISITGLGPILSIIGTPATAGSVGAPYTASYSAINGTGPYTFSNVGTALPAGLSLNTSTGAITGTPTTAGTTTGIQIRVTDALSATATAPAFNLAISAVGPIVQDNYSGTSGTLLAARTATPSGTAWVAVTSDFRLTPANRARGNATVAQGYYNATIAAQCYVQADFVVVTANTNQLLWLYARSNAAMDTAIRAGYSNAAGGWCIFKNVAGTLTQIGSGVAVTLSGTNAVRLEIDNPISGTSAVRLIVNGSTIISGSFSDATLQGAGFSGLRTSGSATSDTTGQHIANFEAGSR